MTLICGAMLCALVRALAGEGQGKGGVDLLCGLFLAMLALSPLGSMEFPALELSDLQLEAEAAAMDGAEQAEEERNAIISREIEAYICNRAEEQGLNLTAQILLDEKGIPEKVVLTGIWTREQQETFSQTLETSLGLSKEAQIWKE